MSSLKSRQGGRSRPLARILMIAAVAIALLGVPVGVAAAPSCVVWAQGTQVTYGTVQAALDASPAGALILVRGICVGSTVVSKNASIQTSPNRLAYRATLDGNLAGSVIKVTKGTTLKLDRLIITRGFYQFPDEGGGGIVNEGTLIMRHSLVSNSTGHNGGGIANLGDATILNSRIDHNGDYQGGNIYNAGTLVMKDSRLTRGGGRFGQGLYNATGASATLERTGITDSDRALPFSGGGIENHGELWLKHSNVSGNLSLWGGGIQNEGTIHIESSTVTDNSAAFGGGGILNGPPFFAGSGSEQVFLVASNVNGNDADFGGGIYNKGVVTLSSGAHIGGNTAGAVGHGGGIFNDTGASVVGITSGTFSPANTPDQCVGCGP